MNQNTIERIGIALADRAYAYRVFHIVFGAEPSVEELQMLSSEQTRTVFERLAKTDEASEPIVTWNRGIEGQTTCADALRRMHALGDALDKQAAENDEYAEALKMEFNKLFMVPGESYVYPWESPYLGKDSTLFKQSTLDVRERYARHGFEAELKGHFPEDHISMMMQFLACVSGEAYEAFANGDDANVRQLLSNQQAFSLAHLGSWLDEFNMELCRKDASGVFFQAAESMRALVKCDTLLVGRLLSSGELGE